MTTAYKRKLVERLAMVKLLGQQLTIYLRSSTTAIGGYRVLPVCVQCIRNKRFPLNFGEPKFKLHDREHTVCVKCSSRSDVHKLALETPDSIRLYYDVHYGHLQKLASLLDRCS